MVTFEKGSIGSLEDRVRYFNFKEEYDVDDIFYIINSGIYKSFHVNAYKKMLKLLASPNTYVLLSLDEYSGIFPYQESLVKLDDLGFIDKVEASFPYIMEGMLEDIVRDTNSGISWRHILASVRFDFKKFLYTTECLKVVREDSMITSKRLTDELFSKYIQKVDSKNVSEFKHVYNGLVNSVITYNL